MKRLTCIAGALATLVAATPTIQDAQAASGVSNKVVISPAAKQILINKFVTPLGTVAEPAFVEKGGPVWIEYHKEIKSINPAANVYKSFNRR